MIYRVLLPIRAKRILRGPLFLIGYEQEAKAEWGAVECWIKKYGYAWDDDFERWLEIPIQSA